MSLVKTYVQVIVPLKLDWEPYYVLDEGENAVVGDMVAVPFASRRYVGVVSCVCDSLPESVSPTSVKEIYSIHSELPRVNPEHIAFWRMIASYYMCTVGEVMKMACPSSRSTLMPSKKIKATGFTPVTEENCIPDSSRNLAAALASAMSPGKVTFLRATLDLKAIATIVLAESGEKNVLWLVPDATVLKSIEKSLRPVFGSRLLSCSPQMTATKRATAERLMSSGQKYVMLGTRTALFMPHVNLGLIIVLDEHDASYKQISPAPRFNARDTAVMLSSVFKSKVLLQSATPSFESVYNCKSKKYACVQADGISFEDFELEIIDSKAELRKNGMAGDVPKRLLSYRKEGERMAFVKLRKAFFPKMEELENQLVAMFGQDVLITDDSYAGVMQDGISTLCVFGIDSLLSKNDFRADERALQEIGSLVHACGKSLVKLIVVTRQDDHGIFNHHFDPNPLMSERKEFNFPPFSRIVDLHIRQENASRCDNFSARLLQMLSSSGRSGLWQVFPASDGFRIILPKDKNLATSKNMIRSIVAELEKSTKSPNMVFFNVDP